ncbi:MAG: hypothetical protein HOC71_09685 [Candidatus Latescibacteria bacterium]|nr:hypothetical protein [Candidatus Latescibacterota bacterium]
MAEGIMNDLILNYVDSKKQFMPIEIFSTGTHAVRGHSASRFAIEVSEQHGINISFHRGKQITQEISEAADLILTLETSHKDYIKRHWPHIDYVYELKGFDRKDEHPEGILDITDPIGMDYDVYSAVFKEIKSEIERVSQTVFSLALEKYRNISN